MWTAKEGNPLRVQNSELQRWAIGSLACTQMIMSDIGVEEEVIVIDIETSIVIRRATTIPARVIPIMPASINVTRNKTMVLIQIEFYSFKP